VAYHGLLIACRPAEEFISVFSLLLSLPFKPQSEFRNLQSSVGVDESLAGV